jgi:hypothetical protein
MLLVWPQQSLYFIGSTLGAFSQGTGRCGRFLAFDGLLLTESSAPDILTVLLILATLCVRDCLFLTRAL